MKEKKTMMKKPGALRLSALMGAGARLCAGAVLGVAAALILSCSPLFEAPAGGSGETGRVVLSVSTGGAAPARTVLPTEVPDFSRYELVFTREEAEDVTVADTAGIAGAGVRQELAVGDWTAAVTAYRTFTVSGEAKEYKAAQGSSLITVAAGKITEATVSLTPLPVADKTVNGIFTYEVSFPGGLTKAELTFGDDEPLTLASGVEASVEKAPGYYDLFILLEKGGLSVGLSEKVHIYAGLESKAEFAFTNNDFVQSVYLAGTLNLSDDVTVSSGTISAYSDAEYTAQIGTASVSTGDGSWLITIPAANIPAGGPVYFKAVVIDDDEKTYVPTGSTTGAVPEEGVQGIVLADTTPPAEVSDPGGTPSGDGQVTLTWADPEDEDLDHIEISWRPNGETPVTVAKETETYTAMGLTNGTEYTFTVKAVDTAGNKSAGSSANVTLQAPTVTSVTINLPELEDGTVEQPIRGRTANPVILPGTIFYGTGAVFTATVEGEGSPSQTVTWTLTGEDLDEATTIDAEGRLTVALADHGKLLTVTATSTVDSAMSGGEQVTAVFFMPSALYGYWESNNLTDEIFATKFYRRNSAGYYHGKDPLESWEAVVNTEDDTASDYPAGYKLTGPGYNGGQVLPDELTFFLSEDRCAYLKLYTYNGEQSHVFTKK